MGLRLLLTVLLAVLPGLATQAPPAQGRHLVAVIPDGFPPTYYKDPQTGQATGFAVDLLNALAAQEGWTVEYRFAQAWDGVIEAVRSGQADVAPNLVVSPERQKVLAFSRPVEDSTVVFFTRQSSERIQEPFPGAKVGFIRRSTASNLIHQYPGCQTVAYDSLQALLFDLLSGQLDLVLTAAPNLHKLAQDAGVDHRLRRLHPPVLETHRAMAVRPTDSDLLLALNAALDRLVETPEYAALHRRWWGEPSPYWTVTRVLLWSGVGVAVALLVMAVWRHVSIRRLAQRLALEVEERTRSEAELRASEARFRTIFEEAKDGIAIFDLQGTLLVLNERFASMRGYTIEALRKTPLWELDTPETAALAPGRMQQMLDGEAIEVILHQRHRDGHVFHVEANGTLVTYDGQPAILTIHRDITERLAMEASLRESEAKYRQLVERAFEGIAIFQNERLVFANAATQRLLGSDRPEDLVGRHFTEFLTPESRTRAQARLVRRNAGEALSPTAEYQVLTQGGNTRDIEVSVGDITLSGVSSRQLVIRDITERRRLETEHRALQAQLAQTQKMEGLGRLAGGIAHDMNNVLAAILGLASATRETHPEGSPTRQALDTILKAAERGGRLVGGLLNFARQHAAEAEPVDLNEVVQETVRLLERTTLARVEVMTELHPGLPRVLGDTHALAHALMNLCVNAVDAMPEGGRLILRTRVADPGRVLLEVQDRGQGMTPEVLEHAMEPFFTTKPQGQGTGLGLSLVFSTVKAHGGDLELDSQPGCGTTVRIRLPIHAAAAPAPHPTSTPVPDSQGRRLQVLLVDDDELIRASTEALLEALGHQVQTLESGEAALEVLKEGQPPDLVILDMNMPGLGGAGTLPRLRGFCPTLPVLLATGRADQTALDLVAAHPPAWLLSKPYTFEDLRQKLRVCLSPSPA